MADTLVQKREYAQALTCLRSALTLVEQETGTMAGDRTELYRDKAAQRHRSLEQCLERALSGQIWPRSFLVLTKTRR